MGLPYPGGPAIAAAARGGDDRAFDFPLPLANDDALDWSFSGLKTSLRYLLRDDPSAIERLPDLAASYERAICRHLVDRLARAVERHPETNEIHLVGGCSANERLRAMVAELGVATRWPATNAYCTDNGAMIAAAGFFLQHERPEVLGRAFDTSAGLPLSLR
jgi:N6-L-threonylcarbamoyladenine synthase